MTRRNSHKQQVLKPRKREKKTVSSTVLGGQVLVYGSIPVGGLTVRGIS